MGDIVKFYEESLDFKRYVDRYCMSMKIDLSTALQHELVRNVAEYYKMEQNGKT